MGSSTLTEGDSGVISEAVPGSGKILHDCRWAGRPSDEKLSYMVRGMKKLKSKSRECPWLPITPQILLELIETWGEQTECV